MTPERWQKVKEVFHSALESEPAERSDFLSSACGDDEALRHEVESLISSHEKNGSFIDAPAYEVGAEVLTSREQLSDGERVGHYEVLSTLGKGGMGEVYLAHDTKLGRKVALKFLPTSFLNDPDRLRRFEQEARAASALNEPNILTIYEIGEAENRRFIATEYIQGETLRQHLINGPLTIAEALSIAEQIAVALTAAHAAGIIHRDIKPENVMLRRDGLVKVLDFGLAKLAEPETGPDDSTRDFVKTSAGMVMGTVAYMSPEQARGLPLDARTDIWSLGVVLYEMISGQPPFSGPTTSDVLVAVLERNPQPLNIASPNIPETIGFTVMKALMKDRDERFQTARELLSDLRLLKQGPGFSAVPERSVVPKLSTSATAESIRSQSTASGERAKSKQVTQVTGSKIYLFKKNKVAIALLLLISVSALVGLYKLVTRYRTPSEAESLITDSAQVVNTIQLTFSPGLDNFPALSPDGNWIAYASDQGGSFELYARQLTSGGREIQLTSDGAQNFQPAWSPDGQRIAYYSRNRGGISLIPALGGVPRQLTQFGSAPAWSYDGSSIAFQSQGITDLGAGARNSLPPSTIWIVASQGGEPRQLTQNGAPAGGHASPSWSPDGKQIVFEVDDFMSSSLCVVAVNGEQPKPIVLSHTRASSTAGADPLFSPDGENIYFTSDQALWRVHLLSKGGEGLDQPVRITGGGPSWIRHPTISMDGKKIAYASLDMASDLSSLAISPGSFASTTPPKKLTTDSSPRHVMPFFSPDGSKIAFSLFRGGLSSDVWMMDADGKNPTQLTTSQARENVPSWLPDGSRVAFLSTRESEYFRLWSTTLVGAREQLLLDVGPGIEFARISPDGKRVAFNSTKSGNMNIWIAAFDGKPATQLTFDKELAGFPSWSPDGQTIAFEMKRGDDNHIMTIPGTGGTPTQVTSEHGLSWPHSWGPDGDKIAFAGFRDGFWNVYWVSRSTREQKQLTDYKKLNAYVRYPAWSPLGNQIVYEYAETTGNIWLIELK